MNIVLRSLTEHDLASASEIVTTAFRSNESRMPELQFLFALRPEVWLLALAQGTPVGTVVATDYGPFAYVGDMTVRPELQRQGIGSALLKGMLESLDARGTPAILLDASEAGAPLYRRFGFVEADRACIFEQVRKSDARAECTHVRLLGREEADLLGEWDAPFFGASRARIFRQLLSDFPGRAWVAEDERGVWSGYLFAQTRGLGPWVARRPEDAHALLQAALELPSQAPWRVTVPQMNTVAPKLLERFGFRLVDASHRHMRRGGTGIVSRRETMYGQTSFGLG
ncbi:MAG: GNAT family N-acetyltransferase [Chloroflexi bacterium]|nr:GNAT family N-acetyltransferase [Chloroflexota bacterium]